MSKDYVKTDIEIREFSNKNNILVIWNKVAINWDITLLSILSWNTIDIVFVPNCTSFKCPPRFCAHEWIRRIPFSTTCVGRNLSNAAFNVQYHSIKWKELKHSFNFISWNYTFPKLFLSMPTISRALSHVGPFYWNCTFKFLNICRYRSPFTITESQSFRKKEVRYHHAINHTIQLLLGCRNPSRESVVECSDNKISNFAYLRIYPTKNEGFLIFFRYLPIPFKSF